MRSDGFESSLIKRFPALAQMKAFRRSQVPYVQQTALSDCGAACLAMVLQYFGKDVSLQECREQIVPGRDGVTAFAILEAARHFGLRGRGLKMEETSALRFVGKGAILHWGFMHFVVFEEYRKDGIMIVDPAMGRRLVAHDELDEKLTGVVLVLEPGEFFKPQAGKRRRNTVLTRYISSILKTRALSRILITSILLQVLALAPPLLIAAITDDVVPKGDASLLLIIGCATAVMAIFYFASTLVRAYLMIHLRTKVDAELTLDHLEHLMNLPYDFFQKHAAGDLMMRLNANATIREAISTNMISGVLDGGMVLIYLILICVFSPLLAAIVLCLALVRVGLYAVTFRTNRDLTSTSLVAEADSRSYQVQMLMGMEVIKSTGSEYRAIEQWSNLFVKTLNISIRQGVIEAWIQAALDFFKLLSPIVVLVFGAYEVLDGHMDLGSMLALNALAIGFLDPLSQLITNALQFQKLGSYLERVSEVFDTAPEQEPDKPLIQLGTLKGALEVRDLSFRYNPRDRYVLENISLNAKPGDTIAIVGSSGSGKSTIAKILLGLYRPEDGGVFVDGVDIQGLDLQLMRRQFGVVNQDPRLFTGTIKSNIALGDNSVPLQRIIEVAKRAQIHDEIAAMPLSYDTPLSENGSSLSGGQRQRLAIARAILRKPPILILDEATSALDAITESQILSELQRLHCTRILIAHRLSTVKNADLIIVLEEGRIKEQGTFGALIAGDGLFARLVREQMQTKSDLRAAQPKSSGA